MQQAVEAAVRAAVQTAPAPAPAPVPVRHGAAAVAELFKSGVINAAEARAMLGQPPSAAAAPVTATVPAPAAVPAQTQS